MHDIYHKFPNFDGALPKVERTGRFLFMEAGGGWSGKKIYLKKLKQEQKEELIPEI